MLKMHNGWIEIMCCRSQVRKHASAVVRLRLMPEPKILVQAQPVKINPAKAQP